MTAGTMSGRCAYCDEPVRPNSMFCLACGQLVLGATPAEPAVSAAPTGDWTAGGAARSSTGSTMRADAVAPAPAPAPAPSPGWRPPRIDRPAPVTATTLSAPGSDIRAAERALATVTLTFSTGDRAVVSGSAVIGRQPQSTAHNSGAQAVEVRDTTRSVSRVHLLLDVDADGVRVSDAGSGNGSSIERAGARTALREGRSAAIGHGDRLWIGDVSAEVEVR